MAAIFAAWRTPSALSCKLPSAEAPFCCDKSGQNESENKKFLKNKDYYLIWKLPTYMEMC